MTDPIGIKAGPVVDRRPAVPVGGAKAAAPVKPVETATRTLESAAANISQAMAAKPPVDAERVARIRKAVEDGRFPLVPSTIADRLLALKLQWDPNDAS